MKVREGFHLVLAVIFFWCAFISTIYQSPVEWWAYTAAMITLGIIELYEISRDEE